MPFFLKIILIVVSYGVIWFGGFYVIHKLNRLIKNNIASIIVTVTLGLVMLSLSIIIMRIL